MVSDHISYRIKQVVAWVCIFIGLTKMWDVDGELAIFLINLSFLIFGGWWLWCDRRDRLATKQYEHQLGEYEQLHSLISETDPDIGAKMLSPSKPAKVDRKWFVVTPVALSCLVLGALMPVSSPDVPVTTAPSSSLGSSTSKTASPEESSTATAETVTVTADPTTVTVTSSPLTSVVETTPEPELERHTPALVGGPSQAPQNGVYYSNCAAARAAGAAPLYRGESGYRSGLDRDADGIACEWSR